MEKTISILDYGAGNVGSVIRMIERSGGVARRISTAEDVLQAKKLVLPGVGAFDHGMTQLASRKLLPALRETVRERQVPILGICLGMQLMCHSSDEGSLPGLGWIDAVVRRFETDGKNLLRIPHMGWNTVQVLRENPLLPLQDEVRRFYFVHSYRVSCNDPADAIALTHYGIDFVSAFQRGKIFGVQFHPEKSHHFGMAVMRRFVMLDYA